MKRSAILVVVIMLVPAAVPFAGMQKGLALGVEVAGHAFGANASGYVTSTFHFPHVPLMFAIGVTPFGNSAFTADYWFAQSSNWYLGLGGYFTLTRSFTSAAGLTAVGASLPMGLQIWPFGQTFEVFLEAAPEAGISFEPRGLDWHLRIGLGFRFWF